MSVVALRSREIDTSVPAHMTGSADVTLLELVQAVSEVTDDEREVVATVLYMLRSGHARLTGSFRGEPIDLF